MNTNYIMILTHDGEFVDYGHITGLEMVQGYRGEGWFPSLILVTIHGVRLEGWKHMVQPYTPNHQLEYHDALSNG
jgi:hypothetical protein